MTRILLLLTLLLVTPLYAETISYEGCTYTGELVDGIPNGQGLCTSPDGSKYVGEWRDGTPDGYGNMILPDGTNYIGTFRNWFYHGHGTLTYDGYKYVGEWKDDEQHGYGVETHDGDSYWGEWRESWKHGFGRKSLKMASLISANSRGGQGRVLGSQHYPAMGQSIRVSGSVAGLKGVERSSIPMETYI